MPVQVVVVAQAGEVAVQARMEIGWAGGLEPVTIEAAPDPAAAEPVKSLAEMPSVQYVEPAAAEPGKG